eukprot:maker-scaffold187_size272365-snap-gene-0.18 protein:Tk10316 transcript:maker-scaffold187_size272365-snap-gene-0.18-mRNA-1 annotation:"activin receptor type-2b-like"
MRWWPLGLGLSLVLPWGVGGSVAGPEPPIVCEYYNQTCLDDAVRLASDGSHCVGNETCPSHKPHTCYAVWHHAAEVEAGDHPTGHDVQMMGCFESADDDCLTRRQCLDDSDRANHRFCCCRGSMCNSAFKWIRSAEPDGGQPVAPPTEVGDPSSSLGLTTVVLCVIIPVFVLILAVAAFCVYRQRLVAHAAASTLSPEDPHRGHNAPPSPKLLRQDVELLEIKARGRFGAVWKGRVNNDSVAVKIFPLQDKSSWHAEQEIYNLPRMTHDNILEFIGIDKRVEQQEYWLMTKFHERGSLCDFLKSRTVSWEELTKIAHSMANGLAHLHEELPPKGTLDMKPAVAHRDFKSKNVLIKADLSACIGDFGLALIFEPGKPCGDTHGQVGTRRYMAPEVLEGAINFSRDSFLRIDMYACGLVLWELASRCHMSGLAPKEYKAPFEEEVLHPTLEQMQELVVNKKARPLIPESWIQNPAMHELVATICECWDQDAEARLSASNVKERVKSFREMNSAPMNNSQPQASVEQQRNLSNQYGGSNSNHEQHEMRPLLITPPNGSSVIPNGDVIS